MVAVARQYPIGHDFQPGDQQTDHLYGQSKLLSANTINPVGHYELLFARLNMDVTRSQIVGIFYNPTDPLDDWCTSLVIQ